MSDILSINSKFTFYILPAIGFVSSSFKQEIFIEHPLAANIISAINANTFTTAELLEELKNTASLVQVIKVLQSLISNKYVNLTPTPEKKQPNNQLTAELASNFSGLFSEPSQDKISISTSFFENLVLKKTPKNTIFTTVYQDTILISPAPNSRNSVCNDCVKTRLLAQRPLLKFVAEYKGDVEVVNAEVDLVAILHRTQSFFVEQAGLLSASFFWQIDLATNSYKAYPITAHGECNSCKNNNIPPLNMEKEIASITFNKTKGFRVFSLQETYSKLLPFVHPYVGIISKLAIYKELDSDLICNYSSGRNLAFASSNKFWLNNHLRSSSGGKGTTPIQAKVSALCEAIERYSMVHQGQKPAMIARFYHNLNNLIHPHSYLNFSKSQYEQRDEINKASSAFHQLIPNYFDELQTVEWNKGYSLTHNKTCYLLAESTFAQYKGKAEDELFSYPDSNGCASGNTYLEAILQGSLELIERDAVAIWWYNMCERPSIDIKSIDNEYIIKVAQFYKSNNRALHILDITTDINIPCFVAVTYNMSTGKEILYGFGCHIDPKIAIERCVTELNQLLPIVQTARSKTSDQSIYQWLYTESISQHPYLDNKSVQPINFQKYYKKITTHCLETAIITVIDNLKHQKIELIAFDLTQTDTQMPVVKMIAPGLRHFWRRTAPGRLYEVPVKLGWRDKPLTENELNPHSITI